MDFSQVAIQLFASFLICVAASIFLEAPKKLIFHIGLLGMIAQGTYLFVNQWYNVPVSVLAACFLISILSQIYARKMKAPVTMFYIPVFFIFVPGIAIYKAAYFLIQADKIDSADALIEALNIAGAIALGVFLSDSLLELFSAVKFRQSHRKKGN